MTKFWNQYILILLLTFCSVGCADDDLMSNQGMLGEGRAWVALDFGHKPFESIEISTRSTLDEVVESQVQDLYVLIFVGNQCIYNNYFGNDFKESSRDAVQQAATNKSAECWWVQNRTSETNTDGDDLSADTYGSICMNTPTFTNGEIYLIANANAYTVNISPEKLGTIRTKNDLNKLTSVLNGNVLTRYGYFPMVAELQGMNITSTGISQTNNSSGNIVAELNRLDAKVKVNVMAATGAESYYGPESDNNKVKVKTFTPVSWQVMNVPKGSFIIENEGNQDDVTGYFNSSTNTFEKSTDFTYDGKKTMNHSFSFYMLENRHTSTGISNYHQRDERRKVGGVYEYPFPVEEEDEKDIWEYAPANATYLILKGYLAMEHSDSGTQEVGADVTYYIHLGDFVSSTASNSGGLNNFSIERNTSYTYNVVIKGVRNIELEVTENVENQSGAVGTIYATKEIIKQFDAHYEQFTTFIDVNGLNPNAMSWYVETPFGQVGSPKLNDNIEQGNRGYAEALKEYDYKWVWFMINPLVGNVYDKKNQWYPGDQNRTDGSGNLKLGDTGHLMDVDEFTQYLKEQKQKYDAGENHIFKESGVAVTVFVDEYYYEKHPISNEKQPGLWKMFVNQPNRMMHILSASTKSADGESCITGGLITIRQRAIQTPYNIVKNTLSTAWGCEVVDESAEERLWFYDENNSHSPSTHVNGYRTKLASQHKAAESANNTSRDNGLYNTVQLLGLESEGRYIGTDVWTKILDYHQNADAKMKDYLKTGYKGMLYTALTRNRDNNGDKCLDASELKWYVASLGQIAGIYIGGLGFQDNAAMIYDQRLASSDPLYVASPNVNNPEHYQPWRRHVVTSSKTTYSSHEGYIPSGYQRGENHRPAVVWAEEGLSTSYYFQENENWGQGDWGPFSIRCIRNLGMEYEKESDAQDAILDESVQPEKLILTERDGGVYSFDLTNVNEASLRMPSTVLELWPTSEFDFNARTYKGFRTHATGIKLATRNLNQEYEKLYNYLTGANTTSTKYATISGFRVPNVREGALMNIYCEKDWWGTNPQTQTIVSTKIYRSVFDSFSRISWAFGYGHASLDANGDWDIVVRPVQDYDPPQR